MDALPTARYAREQDVDVILHFLQQGSRDQDPGCEIAATKERLQKTLHFTPTSDKLVPSTRFCWVILIFAPSSEAAGMIMYYPNYSTWSAAPGICLEELYVVPEYRRLGYARMLMEALASAAMKLEATKIDWHCYKNNKRALRFYEKLGAKKIQNWDILKVDEEDIKQLNVQEGWTWT